MSLFDDDDEEEEVRMPWFNEKKETFENWWARFITFAKYKGFAQALSPVPERDMPEAEATILDPNVAADVPRIAAKQRNVKACANIKLAIENDWLMWGVAVAGRMDAKWPSGKACVMVTYLYEKFDYKPPTLNMWVEAEEQKEEKVVAQDGGKQVVEGDGQDGGKEEMMSFKDGENAEGKLPRAMWVQDVGKEEMTSFEEEESTKTEMETKVDGQMNVGDRGSSYEGRENVEVAKERERAGMGNKEKMDEQNMVMIDEVRDRESMGDEVKYEGDESSDDEIEGSDEDIEEKDGRSDGEIDGSCDEEIDGSNGEIDDQIGGDDGTCDDGICGEVMGKAKSNLGEGGQGSKGGKGGNGTGGDPDSVDVSSKMAREWVVVEQGASGDKQMEEKIEDINETVGFMKKMDGNTSWKNGARTSTAIKRRFLAELKEMKWLVMKFECDCSKSREGECLKVGNWARDSEAIGNEIGVKGVKLGLGSDQGQCNL